MTLKKAIKENIFSLYSGEKNYETATEEIKEEADQLIKLMAKYHKTGSDDTDSREAIINYLNGGLYQCKLWIGPKK